MQVKFAAPSGLEAADKQALADAGGGVGGGGGPSKSASIADRVGGQRAAKTGLGAVVAGFASGGRAGFKRFVKAQGDVSEVICLSRYLSI
jgi:hypothetical protein